MTFAASSRVALAALAALSLVPPALAKGPVTVQVCDPSGCGVVKMRRLPRRSSRGVATSGRPSRRGRLHSARYYELDLDASHPGQDGFFVPSEQDVIRTAVTGRPGWTAVARGASRAVAELGIEPWPAPALTGLSVDGREAADPRPYAELFDPLPRAPAAPYNLRRIEIYRDSDRPSPWTDGYVRAEYLAARDLLYRGGEWFRPPRALAEQIERDAGLAPERPGSRLRPSLVLSVAGGVLLVLAPIAFALKPSRRRSRALAS